MNLPDSVRLVLMAAVVAALAWRLCAFIDAFPRRRRRPDWLRIVVVVSNSQPPTTNHPSQVPHARF